MWSLFKEFKNKLKNFIHESMHKAEFTGFFFLWILLYSNNSKLKIKITGHQKILTAPGSKKKKKKKKKK